MALHNFVCNLKLSSHIRTGVISIFPSLLPYSNTAAKQMSNTAWAKWTLQTNTQPFLLLWEKKNLEKTERVK